MTSVKDLRKKAMADVKAEVKAKQSSRDLLVSEAVRALEETEQQFNQATERAIDWYGMYFPELERLVSSQSAYLELVTTLQDKKNFTQDKVRKIVDEKDTVDKVVETAKNSMGGELNSNDVSEIVTFAKMCLSLDTQIGVLDTYLEKVTREVAPNLTAVAGYKLGAKLIAHAGSLQRLATLPSSTIQIMGAEKALFKHMKSGKKGPKHGLIFQHPLISGSNKEVRGKLSRALATKIGMAVKTDFFGEGKFIGDQLAKDLEVKAKKIKGE